MMNSKAAAFQKFTQERDFHGWAQVYEASDQAHTVVFESAMEVERQKLPTRLYIDDSFYIMLTVRLAVGVVTDSNRGPLLERLNYLNGRYKVFKYYLSQEGDIFLESCIPTGPDHLDCELIYTIILRVVLPHLQEEYKNIMKLVWTN